jgi:hypothetical protein
MNGENVMDRAEFRSAAPVLTTADLAASLARFERHGFEVSAYTGRGPVRDPQDTEYGLRAGAYVDPDGNLLRFGSPLAQH